MSLRRRVVNFTGGPPPVLTYQDNNVVASTNGTHTHSGLNFGAASSDRVLFALVSTNVYSSSSVSGVTIGGVAATRAVRVINNGMSSEIWVASVPSGTSGNVVLSGPGGGSNWSSCVGIYSATGLQIATATDTATASASGTPTISTSVSVQALGIVLAVGTDNIASSGIAWSGVTSGYFTKYVNAAGGASLTATNAATPTVSATFSGNQFNALAVASFR